MYLVLCICSMCRTKHSATMKKNDTMNCPHVWMSQKSNRSAPT